MDSDSVRAHPADSGGKQGTATLNRISGPAGTQSAGPGSTEPDDWKALKRARIAEWKEPNRLAYELLTKDRRLRRWLADPYAEQALPIVDNVQNPVECMVAIKSTRCPKQLRKDALTLLREKAALRSAVDVGMQRQGDYSATPAVLRHDRYRSDYERRLAAALTRLGIRFRYEPTSFGWQDARGGDHRYTPDFQLVDLHLTFVEVKGPGGADGTDRVKMWHVLRQNGITLLLWDAAVIEMIEDMQHASEVMGLLQRTKLVA